MSNYLTEADVAGVLGISVGTLRNRIYSGAQHPPYIPGKKKLFPRDEFEKWQKSRMKRELLRAG